MSYNSLLLVILPVKSLYNLTILPSYRHYVLPNNTTLRSNRTLNGVLMAQLLSQFIIDNSPLHHFIISSFHHVSFIGFICL